MKREVLIADLLLLTTAVIWGVAFSFQKLGMDHLDPIFFSMMRFLLGAVTVFILVQGYQLVTGKRGLLFQGPNLWKRALVLGIFLSLGNGFQQTGVAYTSVANAGFLTSFYVILIPVFLFFFLKQQISYYVWLSAVLATIGVVLLGLQGTEESTFGDILQLIGACFWAWHIIFLSRFLRKANNILAILFWQIVVVTIINAIAVPFIPGSSYAWDQVMPSMTSILFVGILSTGVGFFCQALAQKNAPASHAAIILSFEAVIAAGFGWGFLGETLTLLQAFGGSLVLIAGIYSQQMRMRTEGESAAVH